MARPIPKMPSGKYSLFGKVVKINEAPAPQRAAPVDAIPIDNDAPAAAIEPVAAAADEGAPAAADFTAEELAARVARKARELEDKKKDAERAKSRAEKLAASGIPRDAQTDLNSSTVRKCYF